MLINEEHPDAEVYARMAEWMQAHGVESHEAAAVSLAFFLDRHGYAIVPANSIDDELAMEDAERTLRRLAERPAD